MQSSEVGELRRGADGGPLVTLVMPCLNEEESVGPCITEALDAFKANGWVGEVLVVDNNSTDDSAAIAVAHGARVVPETVKGYGAALRRGISEARGEIVVMADADCTYPLEKIAEIVEPVLSRESDMVLGARLDAATRKSMPFLHRFVGTPAITMLVRSAVGGMNLSDSQSGYRAFRRDQVRDLRLESDGMEFASEMLIRASQAEWRVDERQTGYRERVGESKLSTWSDGWRHLKLIMRMSPQLLLLWPAFGSLVFGVLCLLGAFVIPGGGANGAARWQAAFVGILALGLSATAAAAGTFVGRFAKSAPGRMQRVLDSIVPTSKFRRIGALLIGVGGAVDVALMAWWILNNEVSMRFAAGVCGVATSLLYGGLVMLGGSYVYSAVLRAPAALEPK
jgi:hypothetical protein